MASPQSCLSPSSQGVRKRGRTACTRCKTRKQKCDDKRPVCSNCQRAGANCDKLDMADSPYTRALEERISFLESSLERFQRIPDTPHSLPGRTERVLDDVVTLGSFGDALLVGPSSGPSLNIILDEMLQATVWNKSLADGSVNPLTVEELMSTRVKEPPSDVLGSKLIRAYISQLHSRYPFLDPDELWKLHRERLAPDADRFGIFKLYLVYAIGATLLQLTEKAAFSPEGFYMTALQHISAARESRTTHNIEAMTLLVVYHLRSTSSHGVWYMIGLAMRTCIDLGMHRKSNESGFSDDVCDRRRRLFWTVYYLERMIAISLGRPLSISDRQIDVPLPETGTALQLFHLRRIESRIYHSIYRADKPLTALISKLDGLYRDLESWRSQLVESSSGDLNYPMLHYNRAVRLLIQPFLPLLSLSDSYNSICLRAAGDICQSHKRLHQTLDYGHSFIAVQTVFVAGLTLLYCVWRWKQWSIALADDIRACSLVLFVMSERAPWVQKYRDAFEMLISAAMARLQAGGDYTYPGNDGASAWPIVAELEEWMEQDGGSPVLWMPEFERLHNLADASM